MDAQALYRQLYAPLLAELGPLDAATPHALDPFDPLEELTLSRFERRHERFVTYISSGLALRPEQKRSTLGRFELLVTCDDEGWAREVLTDIARMTFDVRFDGGQTFDLSSWAFETDTLQGVIFEQACKVRIDHEAFGVLRCIGVTRRELAYARGHSSQELLAALRRKGVYPRTDRRRRSVVEAGAELPKTPLGVGRSGSMTSVITHAVEPLDLTVVKGVSGHQGVSAVTVLGRSLDDLNSEEIWFRLDVRLEDDVGLVQIKMPIRAGQLVGPPRLRVAWHEGIVFPPFDALMQEGGTRNVPEANPLMDRLYADHLSRG